MHKGMLVFVYFDLPFFTEKPDVFHTEYFPEEWIDQLYMNEHLILSATDTYKGRMHDITEREINFFN